MVSTALPTYLISETLFKILCATYDETYERKLKKKKHIQKYIEKKNLNYKLARIIV